MFEIVAGELRAKLGTVSAMRQLRSGRDTCAVTTRLATRRHRKRRRCGGLRRHRGAWLRCPWAAEGPGQHVSTISVTGVEGAGGTGGPGCGARGRWRGQAAVLVGGGRARAGLEIDHSERSSRVAISRAGRRRPAHTAARPIKAGHATVENQPSPTVPRTPVAPQAT